MKLCTEVNKNQVLQFALKLVNRAKKNITATMDMDEEIKNPLPAIYHKKLKELSKKGIVINRYVYGPKKLLNVIKKMYPEIITHYAGSIENYQRMLIVDKNEGIFRMKNGVFYTSFKPLVLSLLKYVKIL